MVIITPKIIGSSLSLTATLLTDMDTGVLRWHTPLPFLPQTWNSELVGVGVRKSGHAAAYELNSFSKLVYLT